MEVKVTITLSRRQYTLLKNLLTECINRSYTEKIDETSYKVFDTVRMNENTYREFKIMQKEL